MGGIFCLIRAINPSVNYMRMIGGKKKKKHCILPQTPVQTVMQELFRRDLEQKFIHWSNCSDSFHCLRGQTMCTVFEALLLSAVVSHLLSCLACRWLHD